jgi:hypothetical protein
LEQPLRLQWGCSSRVSCAGRKIRSHDDLKQSLVTTIDLNQTVLRSDQTLINEP